jgi:hypothetical protein
MCVRASILETVIEKIKSLDEEILSAKVNGDCKLICNLMCKHRLP